MRARLALVVVSLCSASVLAGSPSTQKAMNRRAEAQGLVNQVIAGGNPQAAASRLKFLGQEAFAAGALSEALGRSVDDRQRRNLVLALSWLQCPAAEPVLVRALKDDDGAIRMAAVQGLGRIRSKAAGPMLVLLSDKTVGVRKEAAKALGAARVPKISRALLDAARAEGEPEARAAMLVAVGESGEKQHAKALEGFLAHSSESTRFAAAQALCLLGAARGHAFAQTLLSSQDRHERRQGLALFEGARAREAQAVLKPLLGGPDRALAAGAARILTQGGDGSALSWLVLASHSAQGEDKLVFETELETLRLADDQRRAILAKAGVK